MAVFIKQVNIPQKGDLINLDMTGSGTAQQYRVLKNVGGNVVEVVGMTYVDTSSFLWGSNVYENCAIDTLLNTTWYNTLSNTAKLAIVDKTFRQDSWYYGNQGDPDYSGYNGTTKPGTTAYTVSLDNSSFGNQITRHCYALSVQDILDYVLDTNITDGELQNYNIWKMLWNDEVQHTGNDNIIWLRSAASGSGSNFSFCVAGEKGYLSSRGTESFYAVHSAFQIDLSKIDYTSADGRSSIELKPVSTFQKSNNALSRVGMSYKEPPTHCIVSGLGSESLSSVTFIKSGNFTKAGLGIEEVTFNGDTFIKIPTLYRKVNTVTNNQITSFTISNTQEDNDFHPYSVFVDESGNTLDYVLMGKYWNTNSSSMVSVQETNIVFMSISSARTNARNRGAGYLQYDWQFQKLWQDLIICFKETVDTNNATTGWTYDELGIFWGTNGCWVDGVSGNTGEWIFSDKPSTYIDRPTSSSSGYKTASYSGPTTTSLEISKLGYDNSNEFFNYPNDVTNNDQYNTYYCDAFVYQSGGRPISSFVGYNTAGSGAFSCYVFSGWSGTNLVRLCYRPLYVSAEPVPEVASGGTND